MVLLVGPIVLYIYKHMSIPRRCCVELGRLKFDQKAFHDYGFLLISSFQSKSSASSSSSDKVKRDFLEKNNLSLDPSS